MSRTGMQLARERLNGQVVCFMVLVLLVFARPAGAQQVGTGETPDLPISSSQAGGAPDPFSGTMVYRLPLQVLPGRHGM